ncbi:uncharacterized protein EAF01_001910 [Botrytis porri]|uniref:uncharacterized protein n=1 Tax=Botrytis porri TaxID=87229 RepID=UPI001900F77A|nr:uncharacterized protein EAF01_001910 [Botrytis porri]KAF7912889.1 hypothetical protein EAF01_001910 [Botrytis porri]
MPHKMLEMHRICSPVTFQRGSCECVRIVRSDAVLGEWAIQSAGSENNKFAKRKATLQKEVLLGADHCIQGSAS